MIIPLVIYNGEHRWHVSTEFVSLFEVPDPVLREYLPDFRYNVYDFSPLSDEEIKGTVLLRAMLMAMKYMTSPQAVEYLPRIFSLFKDLSQSGSALQYVETLLRYIVDVTDQITEDDIKNAIQQIDKEEIMSTLAQQWMEKGMILEAQEMVMEAAMERFGELASQLSSHIKSIASREVLKLLHKVAIKAESFEEFQKELARFRK